MREEISIELDRREKELNEFRQSMSSVEEAFNVLDDIGSWDFKFANGLDFHLDIQIRDNLSKEMDTIYRKLSKVMFRSSATPYVSSVSDGLVFCAKRGRVRLIITAIITGTKCKRVVVGAEEQPIYEIKCG